MRKTPPYLKSLAERRPRAAGEVMRVREIVGTVAGQLAKAETTLAEVDAQLHRLESRVDPADISPIRARSTHHGLPRGALVTSEIADKIQVRFQIELLIEKTRMNWRHDWVPFGNRRVSDPATQSRGPPA